MQNRRQKKPQPPQARHKPSDMRMFRDNIGKHQPRAQRKRAPTAADTPNNLLLTFFFLSLIGGAYASTWASKKTIHDKTLHNIPDNADCHYKWVGISKGQKCELADGYYHLKLQYIDKTSNNEASATISSPGFISTEAFNRELMQQHIGVPVPETKFFKQKHAGTDYIYIGGKAVKDLKHTGVIAYLLDQRPDEIGEEGVAQLAVANTFIRDINRMNWGYNDDGLVLIDVDNVKRLYEQPQNLSEYIDIAISGIRHYSYGLSLNNLVKMIEIYKNMRNKPLPKFHQEAGFSKELYDEVIVAYIATCQDTYTQINNKYPTMPASQRTMQINKYFVSLLSQRQASYLDMAKELAGRIWNKFGN